MPTKKNHKLYESSFRAGKKENQGGVARPTMGDKGTHPPGNASNSAKPVNPGGLNVLKKINQDGSFKTSV